MDIYGGFAGTELFTYERTIATNTTVFNGDIGTQSDNTDNSHHVMFYAAGVSGAITQTPTIDGITFTQGYAPSTTDGNDLSRGAGLLLKGGGTTVDFVNCNFTDNYAQPQ